MSIIDFDRLPSCSLDVRETGESIKCVWVGVVEGMVNKKIGRLTVMASLYLV